MLAVDSLRTTPENSYVLQYNIIQYRWIHNALEYMHFDIKSFKSATNNVMQGPVVTFCWVNIVSQIFCQESLFQFLLLSKVFQVLYRPSEILCRDDLVGYFHKSRNVI